MPSHRRPRHDRQAGLAPAVQVIIALGLGGRVLAGGGQPAPGPAAPARQRRRPPGIHRVRRLADASAIGAARLAVATGLALPCEVPELDPPADRQRYDAVYR